MTSFPRAYVIDKLTDTKKFKVLYRDGLDKDAPKSGRGDADNAPYFTDAMAGKVKDPKMLAAYNYWLASKVFKWVALPPKTPAAIRAAYRKAFDDLIEDPEFEKQAKSTLESFYVIPPEKAEDMIRTLAATSDEAIRTTEALMREQGLKIGKEKEKGNNEKDEKS
jgi:hypothetical protein